MRSNTKLFPVVIIGLASSAGAQPYSVSDLGTVGGPIAVGFGLNAAGAAVGASTLPNAHINGLYAAGGVATPIAPLSGDNECWAFGLDTAGTAIAMSFSLGSLATHGLTWQGGQAVSLGNFAPRAISNNGQIAGFISLPDAMLGQVDHAAVWQGGAGVDLGTLGGSHSYAAGINGFGQVVGWSYTAGDAAMRAAIWQGGAVRDLGTLGGATSQAYAISNNRAVVGVSDTAAGQPHAFFFVVDAAGAVTMRVDLGVLGGGASYAYAVNTSGDVVGTSASRAFRWHAGTMTDLNAAIPGGSGWVLERAWAINDSGQIVGSGVLNGMPRGFLLRPSCYANCDQSTTVPVLNVLDFSCFLNKFAAGDPYANCDGSVTPPVLNVLDFGCFLNRFGAGCP